MVTRARRRFSGRRNGRKFIWHRTIGSFTNPVIGADLLSAFRSEPGATHLGATITRIRGYVKATPTGAGTNTGGIHAFRVDSWNEDASAPANQPQLMPDEDWLGWLPWEGASATNFFANSDPGVSVWAVDLKAQRKLEELNQTLWLFTALPTTGTYTVNWNLSIGMKLP